MIDLQTFWFVALGVLLAGYAVLDGFDLGVGILHLGVKRDEERRLLMNSIGPLWDGNEVWLVTFGGALFAAFPKAYAAAFSGFYIPFVLLLFALIFRAVSMEFRSKRESASWRAAWDRCFFAASLLATFLFGTAVGFCLRGVPLGADGEIRFGLADYTHPYPYLVGLLAVATFAMHGAIYLHLKTTGELQARVQRWMWHAFGWFLVTYLFTTLATLVLFPVVTRNFATLPWAWIGVALNVLAIANVPRAIYLGKPVHAFLSSTYAIVALTFLFGLALFPNLIASSLDPAHNLTIYNAASSEKTLRIMRTIAFIGLPFVLTYTAIIYWVFRGKVELGKFSY